MTTGKETREKLSKTDNCIYYCFKLFTSVGLQKRGMWPESERTFPHVSAFSFIFFFSFFSWHTTDSCDSSSLTCVCVCLAFFFFFITVQVASVSASMCFVSFGLNLGSVSLSESL